MVPTYLDANILESVRDGIGQIVCSLNIIFLLKRLFKNRQNLFQSTDTIGM